MVERWTYAYLTVSSAQVAAAVLPNTGVVVYDWKNFTLQELICYIKKVLGGQKVTSIAVCAPGDKPGNVGELVSQGEGWADGSE